MVNDVSSNSANLALINAAAGQRQQPVRTESPAETQRPVPPTEGASQQAGVNVSISPQARAALAANDNENTESAQSDQRRNDDSAGQASRGRSTGGAAQYRAVLQAVGA